MYMTGKNEGKRKIKCNVYLHEKGKSNARITHIDIESPIIGKIIGTGATYCAGKPGGCFIGLKKEMIKRAENFIKKKKK